MPSAALPMPVAEDADFEPRHSGMSMDSPAVQKSLLGLFNKRGYNLQASPRTPHALYSPAKDPNASFGSTASWSSNSNSVLSFREPVHGQAPIHIAIRRGDLKVLEALVRSDETLELEDDHGNTPLHFAVGTSRRISSSVAYHMVSLLLAAGANVHAINGKGFTPIVVHLMTLRKDDPTILKMLLHEGAEVESEIQGESLLHVAVAQQMPIVAATLVSYGANINTTNTVGLPLSKVASAAALTSILAHLTHAQPYVPIQRQHQCMDCGRRLTQRGKAWRWLRFLFKSEARNCYHCGWLFCSSCTALAPVRDALPASFDRREDVGDYRNKNVLCCRVCANLLKERLGKRRQL
ncbi:myosin-like protein [Achlya hypogyna]|uniref:Myosin-like protein n=1 Tax=Achlya hypogyna TaxID=1202772 RepID=A0A1V9Y6J0_ACHHY|nr:myosin-like protein [Achlya hypogyna]